jgi:hypothetical protein
MDTTENDRIALVILNYNQTEDTINLCSSLLDNLEQKYSVFIVDNNSNDSHKLQQFVETNKGLSISFNHIPLRTHKIDRLLLITSQQNFGYAKGNNIALRLAHTGGFQYAFIINPDVLIKDFKVFDSIVSIFKSSKKKIGIAGPSLILPDGSLQRPSFHRKDFGLVLLNFLYPFSSCFFKLRHKIELKQQGYFSTYFVIGCFFGLNLRIWHECNFFDENTFLYHEEAIIAERLRKIDAIVIHVPSLSVIHNHTYVPEWGNNNQSFLESKKYYEKNYLNLSRFSKIAIRFSEYYKKPLNRMYLKLRGKNFLSTHE